MLQRHLLNYNIKKPYHTQVCTIGMQSTECHFCSGTNLDDVYCLFMKLTSIPLDKCIHISDYLLGLLNHTDNVVHLVTVKATINLQKQFLFIRNAYQRLISKKFNYEYCRFKIL